MYNLLIGNYNNYFNRIVKKEETDFRYFTVMGNTTVIKNINFNPNDGVFTQVILGKGDYLLPESATRPIQPDYAVLYKTELENPPYIDAKIISRWFIIEAVRTRSGQYSTGKTSRRSQHSFSNALHLLTHKNGLLKQGGLFQNFTTPYASLPAQSNPRCY